MWAQIPTVLGLWGLSFGCAGASNRVSEDEKLFRELAYQSQQVAAGATGTAEEWKKYWKFSVDNTFPPYVKFITEEALEKCLRSDLNLYKFFTLGFMSLEIGSSLLAPNWTKDVELPDGSTHEIRASDYGRTYLARVKIFKVGGLFGGKEEERDIHYAIVGGKAFFMYNYDYCLEFKSSQSD